MHTDIGVTATRQLLSTAQLFAAWTVLNDMKKRGAIVLHHGDCVGGDSTLNSLAQVEGYRTVAHPPINNRYRAFALSDEVRPPKPYQQRNRDIVIESGYLIACPLGEETKGSGTWSTIRIAKRLKRNGHVIWPDGSATPLAALVLKQLMSR